MFLANFLQEKEWISSNLILEGVLTTPLLSLLLRAFPLPDFNIIPNAPFTSELRISYYPKGLDLVQSRSFRSLALTGQATSVVEVSCRQRMKLKVGRINKVA